MTCEIARTAERMRPTGSCDVSSAPHLFVVLGDDPVADQVEDTVLGADVVVDRALRH